MKKVDAVLCGANNTIAGGGPCSVAFTPHGVRVGSEWSDGLDFRGSASVDFRFDCGDIREADSSGGGGGGLGVVAMGDGAAAEALFFVLLYCQVCTVRWYDKIANMRPHTATRPTASRSVPGARCGAGRLKGD